MRTWTDGRPVTCRRCGDAFTVHEAGGGECRAFHDNGPCLCPGFRWVDPKGTEQQGYGRAPVTS